MKKGYKRLLYFETILLVILLLDSFVVNILSRYNMIIFLIITLIAFKLLFGFEKDRNRYYKDIIIEVIIFLLIFFLLYYLFGIIIGFYKPDNYYSLYGITNFIIPIILLIILKEILRYMMLKKSEGSRLLYIMSCILFIFIDISNAIYYNSFSSSYNVFLLIAINILPAISRNIVFTLMTPRTGYKPIILYLLITNLYAYLIPIVPNPNEYILSIVQFLLPVVLGYRIYLFYQKAADEEINRDYNKSHLAIWIFPIAIVIVLVYFTSGYFHYYAVAVASGSMKPNIYRGDVVIIEKIDKQYQNLQVGQVIAYKYNGITIIHRLVKIIKDKEHYYFYTKGDANEKEDDFVIDEDMIIGIVNLKVPMIGYPTVWLNEI